MRWCVIRHPEIADTAVIAEDSLEHYEARGWARVSGWATDPHLPKGQFPLAEEAPAPEPAPEPEPERKPAKSSSKESS